MQKIINTAISSLKLAATITVPGTIILFAVMAPLLLFEDATLTGLAIVVGIIGYIGFITIAVGSFLTEYIE